MYEFLKLFLSMSLSGSLLILFLLLMKPLLKNRLSKRWQYYIWLIAIGRLLLWFAPQTNLMQLVFQKADHTAPQITALAPDSGVKTVLAPQGGGFSKFRAEPAPFSPGFTAAAFLLPLLLLTVALLLFIRKLTIYQSFVRYVKAGWSPVSDISLLDRLALLEASAGVKKAV